jgi:hypothetical protein
MTLKMWLTKRRLPTTPVKEVNSPTTPRWVSALCVTVLSFSPLLAQPEAKQRAVEVEMRNVNFRVDPSIIFEIRRLRGEMIPTSASEPVSFDNRKSFVIRIQSAEIAISARAMSDLLNRYVFAYPGAPLKNLALTIDKGRVKQKGTMHKGIDLPFEVDGRLDATAEGQVRFHADKIKSAHIPFKGLLHLFGEDLSKLINVQQARGIRLEGDDMLLSVDRMTPPPTIQGKVTAVRLEGDRIVQTFGGPPPKPLPLPYKARNYIYHRGGILHFGKLTMTDADLLIVDQSPATPFDFSLADYNRQLTAGYSKNTAAHGLIVFMPDYGSLSKRR